MSDHEPSDAAREGVAQWLTGGQLRPKPRTPLSYEELMYRLSHCDDCGCSHAHRAKHCKCVCHEEIEE